MTEIDTATARRIHATADDMKHGDCHTARAVLTGMMPNMLNEIDRLRAENQRLEALIIHDAGGRAVTQGSFNAFMDDYNRFREQRDNAKSRLAIEAIKYRDLWDEAETVLRQLDGLAEQWGDEGVFRRCRDRLRAAVESTGGGE